MRCAHLLHRWSSMGEPADRTGGGRFVEVYPAGALVRWGLDASGYKGPDTAALGTLVSAVSEAVPSLGLSAADRELCASVHDAFDALVAALVGRAALLGLTDLPPRAVREQAAEEGWIHLPLRGSLPLVARSRSQLRCAPAAALSRRLAANVFAPWLSVDEPVPFHGESFAGETQLEVKCSSGLPGTPPTLDCLIDGPQVLAVESKCTETFAAHHADFKPADRDVVAALADDTWLAEYERLAEDPRRYRFLDAAQLVKHYLGLRRRFADRPITLAYLYWQPSNATDIAPCMIHAAELAEFSRRVGDPDVRFVGMSYAQLWDDWTGDGRPAWLREHGAALRQRYDVAV
jgi:hypothetical protein